MQNILLKAFVLLLIGYIFICITLYFIQERLIFFPHKLDKHFRFTFDQPFEEINFTTKGGKNLNGVLFLSDSSKGLVFYLHGNAGAVDTWGDVAKRYTNLHYDVFIPDYRGYGKSEGSITSESQLLEDVQAAYNTIKQRYKEENIVIVGYSLGSGPAAWLASVSHPKLLMLQAPYYSLTDIMRHTYSFIPTFLLKYKLETNKYIKNCTMPVVIFHGDKDEIIYYGSSIKLKTVMKNTDTLISLKGQGHNGITDNQQYISAIGKILN